MARPTRAQLERVAALIDDAGNAAEFIRWARLASRRTRRGRPSFDDIDAALIQAALRAALSGDLPLSEILRVNVLLGALPGNSKASTVKRIQRKARAVIRIK